MRLLCASALLLYSYAAYGTTAADLARGVRQIELDPQECYRVRELTLTKEDVRIYLTDGYLIFSKPIGDVHTSAVFTADVEAGDAELLVLPPNRSERQSLANFTGSPTLNEHFKNAVLIFADDTYRAISEQISSNPFNRKSAEMGLLLADTWTPVVRNLSASFETRLVLDLLSHQRDSQGFFFSAIAGKELGNIDVIYDPRGQEQIAIGQTAYRDNRTFFDIWMNFEARSFRNRSREMAKPEFSLKDFRITAVLDPPDLRMRVITKVTVQALQLGWRVIPLDISRQMHVSVGRIDGKPAEVFQRESMRSNLIRNSGNDLFLLIAAEPLDAGREYEIELEHDGAVVSEVGKHVYAVGSRGNWYPNRGLQFTNYDLTFRYPKELDLVSTGDITEDKVDGDWRVTRRRTSNPVRLAGFNLGVYERTRISRAADTIEVCANRGLERALQPKPQEPVALPPLVWPKQRRSTEILPLPSDPVIPRDPLARLQELASEVASSLEFMSARFGPPPLRSLTVAPVPGAFGQGFPGLIYLSTLAYLGAQDKAISKLTERQQIFFSEILQAHEVAHQWWGNLVTARRYQDDWLMESLANYSALLYLEKRKGTRQLETVLEQYKSDLLARGPHGRTVESAGPIAWGSRLTTSQAPNAWSTITYEKGSWIVHMLRRRMGDERFFSMLAELRRRFERKGIGADDFRLLASEFLPPKSPDPKLEAFFDQWIYSTGIPSLQLKYSLRGKAPNLKLVGTVIQTDVDEEFSVMAPIDIQFGRGKAQTHWVRTGNEPASFTVPLRQPPTKVLLDPGSSILARK
jgi:hypothetical protein